jgi:diguanylate cyclase (GGDEF)-like protein
MRVRFWLGLAAVTAIAAGSVVAGLDIHASEQKAFERRQSQEARRSARQAEAVARLSIGQLASAAAFYRAEGHFTQHEFNVMADSLLGSGALAATAFVQSVPQSRRARFERGHGFPIVGRAGPKGGGADRVGRYFPLTYADSYEHPRPPVGYNLGTDPMRAPSLRRARDTGRPAASSVTRLLIGGNGINVFRPVYRDGAPTGTVAERRAALTGFAVGAFHVPDLADAATSALRDDVDVQLLEGDRSLIGPALARSVAASAQIRIADRTWLLVVHDPRRPAILLPILISVLGLLLALLLGALVVIWNRNEQVQELEQQASHDSLTGLKNRRRFEEDLRTELARSRRQGSDGALLMLDLDNFKQVNDTLGHPMGDRVIEEIASVLRDRIRESDVLARLGGDEFAVVLPNCTTEKAKGVAEAIATAIRDHVPREPDVPPITASIGIAMFGHDGLPSLESIVAAADTAMYAAKSAGRDAVRVAVTGGGDTAGASLSRGDGRA